MANRTTGIVLSSVGGGLSCLGAVGLFGGLAMLFVCKASDLAERDTGIGMGEIAEGAGTAGGTMFAAAGGMILALGILLLVLGMRAIRKAKEEAAPPGSAQ